MSHPYTEVGGSGGKNLAKALSCVISVVFAHSEGECEDVKRLAFLTRGGGKIEDRSRERLEGSKHNGTRLLVHPPWLKCQESPPVRDRVSAALGIVARPG